MSKRKPAKKHESASNGLLKAICIALGVVLALMIGYGALCTRVKNADTILPNTYALGINLGGMTEAEAEQAVERQLSAQYANETLSIAVDSQTVQVTVADLVQVDGAYAAQAAMNVKNDLSFLEAGKAWFTSRGKDTVVDAGEAVTFQNLDSIFTQLETAIADAQMDPTPTSYELTDTQVIFTNGIAGQTVDQEGLKAAVLSALERADFETVIPCPMTTINPEEFDLQAVYDAVYTPAQDATCDKDGNVVSDVKGFSFDLTAAQQALAGAAEGEQVAVDLIFTDPEITAETLQSLLFRDVLGTCTTNVGGGSNRVNNVKLAAGSCNNYILLPGETFAYNETVGERTAARGYKEAGAYVSGETVEVLGGGICQVSSTIYLACLRADMEITERHNHTYVSSYMPYGQDATVSWGGPDFKFTNNTDYPVKIVTSYSGGQLTASIYGTNLTGKYVKITNEVISTTSYQTIYEDTTALAAGQTQVKTTGYNGMKVKVYRNVYNADGTLISSTLESNNTYSTRNKVILRGIGTTTSQTPTTPTETTPPAETTAPTPTPDPVPSTSPDPVEPAGGDEPTGGGAAGA